MKNKFWTIIAKSSSEIEILLYEMIGQDFWTGEGTTAKQFAEDLRAAGPLKKIHLRVNSPGGSVFDGLAIYNTLLSHGAKVTAQVDGLAASIASVIVMAASEISMGENSMLMVHNPSTLVEGDSNAMLKMADTLSKVKTSMITGYRRHSSLSVEKIGALMDAETWMTASEAVNNYGFAEEVIDPSQDDDDLAAAVRTPIFAKFRRVPPRFARIAARYAPDDDDERRRRIMRQHTLEMQEMQAADSRRATLATHELELANMRAAEATPKYFQFSDDLQRRRKMAQYEQELKDMRNAELAKLGGGSVDEGRRVVLAQREREVAAWAPKFFQLSSCGAGGRLPQPEARRVIMARRESENDEELRSLRRAPAAVFQFISCGAGGRLP
jgi:ATP-dependent Clp protease protease subunit